MKTPTPPLTCERCKKIEELCVCEQISPLPTRIKVLILQHPQESDHELGTAWISHLSLPQSTLRVGLSWPNLNAALNGNSKTAVVKTATAARWAVLYLGSGIKGKATQAPLQFVSRAGAPVDAPEDLEGIVVIDGSWSQAKALWWRNAWLLKLKRAVLIPQHKSLYRELRKEPRRECLSTLESIAEALEASGETPDTSLKLRALFAALLDKQRARKKSKKASAAPVVAVTPKSVE